jgi:hypothetical protein
MNTSTNELDALLMGSWCCFVAVQIVKTLHIILLTVGFAIPPYTIHDLRPTGIDYLAQTGLLFGRGPGALASEYKRTFPKEGPFDFSG